MRCYEASSTILASPESVWAVLSDGAGWSTWDSGIDEVEGRIELGATIKIRSQASPGRTFPVKVTTFDAPLRLSFSGGMPFGLFRGIRSYDLFSEGGAATDFHMREEYTGPLVPLIWRSMPDLGPSFDRFAKGLKWRVESGG